MSKISPRVRKEVINAAYVELTCRIIEWTKETDNGQLAFITRVGAAGAWGQDERLMYDVKNFHVTSPTLSHRLFTLSFEKENESTISVCSKLLEYLQPQRLMIYYELSEKENSFPRVFNGILGNAELEDTSSGVNKSLEKKRNTMKTFVKK
ncbi:hypothetical protein G9A89_009686 [Geosiphon pyriformis]|nr:hypothetical protein G9A89_009686 [Geosiphon pyriformis]